MIRRAVGIRRRLMAAVTERLGYKAVALFLAIALWLFTYQTGRNVTP